MSAPKALRRLLTLYSKPQCSLCDEAKVVIDKVAGQMPLDVKVVNIDLPENQVYHEEYEYDIPVGHLDGKFLFKHRVTEELLKQHLNNPFGKQ